MTLKIISLIWCGMILGVSFLATPAKFLAADLPLDTALDIGRHTFGIFLRVEVVFAIIVLIATFLDRTWLSYKSMILILLPIILLGVQFFWLISVLNMRVHVIMQGELPPDSCAHNIYAAFEFIKVVCLFSLTFTVALPTRNLP